MIRDSQIPYLGLLIGLLLLKIAMMVLLISYAGIGLSPDEAQYWTWSQQLDWGYYSKPPAVAWQIFVGTRLFGNTLLGIRAFSLLMGAIAPLLLYFLALKCSLRAKTAFWSALLLAFTPLGIISSMLAITDVGMTVFWICALIPIVGSLSKNRPPNYYLVGFFIALGALFKWPIYLLWLLLLLLMPFFLSLRSRHYWGGVLLSLAGLLPSLVWNMRHGWATFRHVTSSIQGGGERQAYFFAGNCCEFVGAQIGLLSPIIFGLLVLSTVKIVKDRERVAKEMLFCCYATWLLLGSCILLSLFKKVQGNWCDYAYPSALLLVAWYGCHNREQSRERWLKGGVALSVALSLLVFSVPILQSANLLHPLTISYKINPFKHTLGWENLPKVLEEAGYCPGEEFLFSSNYQMSSILSFYSPARYRAYFFNLFGIRNNQFNYWPSMLQEQMGKDGYYVIAENQPHLQRHREQIDDYLSRLTPYFEEVEFVGLFPLFTSYGEEVKGALIFRGRCYNGKQPDHSQLY